MTYSQIPMLVSLVQPFLVPYLTAHLADPQEKRLWLKILIVVVLTGIATALQVTSWTPLDLPALGKLFIQTLTANQAIRALFKGWLGQVENQGQGLGVLVDKLAPAPPIDPWAPAPGNYEEN